jgi:hypothetical protein
MRYEREDIALWAMPLIGALTSLRGLLDVRHARIATKFCNATK